MYVDRGSEDVNRIGTVWCIRSLRGSDQVVLGAWCETAAGSDLRHTVVHTVPFLGLNWLIPGGEWLRWQCRSASGGLPRPVDLRGGISRT